MWFDTLRKMRSIGRCLRGALSAGGLPGALLDVLRPTSRVPRVSPRGRASHLRRRASALFLLLKIATALRMPLSCRRVAFAVYRALARTGVPARLRFGIRRARPDEPGQGSYIGHVWVSRGREPPPVEFSLTILSPSTQENAGWRRG